MDNINKTDAISKTLLNKLSKILYLDNDVICRKDCQEFYNQDMEKYEIARVFRLLWKVVFQK